MKLRITTLGLSVLILFLISCTKEANEMLTENTLSCKVDFKNHPHSESYQTLVDNYASDGFVEQSDQVPAGLVDSYWDRYNNGNIENNTDIQLALAAGLRGSDGIITSIQDLKVFIQALAGGQLIKCLPEMTTFLDVPEEIKDREVYSGYGMGLMKVQISDQEWYGHFGNHIGSGALMLYNADEAITIIAFQNTGTFFSDELKGKFFYKLLKDIETIIF